MTTKITFSTGIVLAGIFMYLLGRSLWGNLGGVISAIFYIYAPYNALNIYVRGDLAEIWGYAFVPLFFYGIIGIYQRFKIKYVLIASVGFAAIVLSHNLTAYMTTILFVPTILFLALISKQKTKFLALCMFSFIWGLLLTSFYFIPALLELQYTNIFSQIGGGADFREHFVCLRQLWESSWGFGGSAPGCLYDGMSFRVGKLHLAIVFVSLFVFLLVRKRLVAFLELLFFISVFFMLSASQSIWEIVPLMDFLQYPWRFLIFASFSSSLLTGSLFLVIKFLPAKIKEIARLFYTVSIVIFVILLYSKLFVPQKILPKNPSDYTEESVLNYKISKISDEYLPANFNKPENISQLPRDILVVRKGHGEINILSKKVSEIKARVKTDQESMIHANLAYFPAWKVNVNGEDKEIYIKNDGFDFDLPPGESEIAIIFSQTLIEKMSNTLSLLAFLFLVWAFKTRVMTR